MLAIVSDSNIYIMNADGSQVQQLTDQPRRDDWPTWSPDGKQIAFMSERDGGWNIYAMDVDEGDSAVRQLTSFSMNWEPAWSPDGEWIAFGSQRDGNSEIYLMNPSGSSQRRLTTNRNVDGYPSWLPRQQTNRLRLRS